MTSKNRPKIKLLLGILCLSTLILFVGIFLFIKEVNNFFQNNYLQFNKIVSLQLKRPIEIKKREPIVQKIILEYPEEIDTPLEIYICNKFGTYECKTSLAIAKAESGIREEAFNINTNDTIDIGVFQINSIHFTKPGCSLKEIVDAEKNVDCAYTIWKASGWNPWVSYKNGNFLRNVE